MSMSIAPHCTGIGVTWKRFPLSLGLAGSIALLAGCGGLSGDRTVVTVESGILQGAEADGVLSFKGIPYAAPPVGNLRWRPTQPAAPWSGTRPATAFGHDCMQQIFPNAAPTTAAAPSEDCLFLNVWRPASEVPARDKLPVLVYIHGGAYTYGSGASDGKAFAREGVMLVTFNYRLGRFGFFAHPALTAEQPNELVGNYAYMDQVAALKWIQRNIAAFGGDPGNVTVSGESAGGESVHSLLTTPLAKGLFQKAIVQSGNGRENQVYRLYLRRNAKGIGASGEEIGVAFAKSVGIDDTGAGGLAALRALSADQVQANLYLGYTYAGGPMIEGKMVVDEPGAQYVSGQFTPVPLLIGSTDLDLGFPAPARTKDEAFAIFGAQNLAAARAAFDPKGTATVDEVRNQIARVQLMDEPARFAARIFAAHGQPAYVYRFSYVAESVRDKVPGAVHAAEMPYVFGTLADTYGSAVTSQDTAVSRLATGYWAQFAKSGNPNGGGRTPWPAYAGDKNGLLDFTAAGTAAAFEADPLKAQIDLVQAVSDRKAAQ
ncbi:carboxylic ester hydrolase [Pseudoduganella albidiflava]|uniref:Carboxylic ester hydrolase n=2 Tax=Pseudoduganella albidiflava TaxID=321983 RepID=A0A411WVL2_9BURK|nr:carboxylesterase family protein [Pseudoduganella albidiflava]GGY30770.1 carboxylic ester hydrolase [Pseudoduganella albidiflava]